MMEEIIKLLENIAENRIFHDDSMDQNKYLECKVQEMIEKLKSDNSDYEKCNGEMEVHDLSNDHLHLIQDEILSRNLNPNTHFLAIILPVEGCKVPHKVRELRLTLVTSFKFLYVTTQNIEALPESFKVEIYNSPSSISDKPMVIVRPYEKEVSIEYGTFIPLMKEW